MTALEALEHYIAMQARLLAAEAPYPGSAEWHERENEIHAARRALSNAIEAEARERVRRGDA